MKTNLANGLLVRGILPKKKKKKNEKKSDF